MRKIEEQEREVDRKKKCMCKWVREKMIYKIICGEKNVNKKKKM